MAQLSKSLVRIDHAYVIRGTTLTNIGGQVIFSRVLERATTAHVVIVHYRDSKSLRLLLLFLFPAQKDRPFERVSHFPRGCCGVRVVLLLLLDIFVSFL